MSSFETTIRAPSGVMSKLSGSEPPGSIRVRTWARRSTSAIPSNRLSGSAQPSSSIHGGHLGEPETAT